jgi:hypothetical protein
MVFSGFGVLLCLFVFAHRVVVLGLEVVMRGGVVMTSRGLMLLCRGMFRHWSAPLLRITCDPKSHAFYIPLTTGNQWLSHTIWAFCRLG